jgi:hypothetical protein
VPTLRERQLEMYLRQRSKPRPGWKWGRKRNRLARLANWMQDRLDEGYSSAEVARMVGDDLKIKPEEVRSWLRDRYKPFGMIACD